MNITGFLFHSRFHNPGEEPVLDSDIIPSFSDNVQLSIEEYRDILYEVLTQLHFTSNIKNISQNVSQCRDGKP